MHARLTAFIVLLLSGFLLVVSLFVRLDSGVSHWMVTLLLIIALVSLRGFWSDRTKVFFARWGKWWMLFLSGIIVPLVVLSTGSVYSPFLVLLHFAILGIGFFFGFFTALLFLFVSMFLLALSLFLDPVIFSSITDDPVTVLLYLVSFLTLIPIAWLLSHHYSAKDRLFDILQSQVKVEESIMQSLQEMIFVTDREMNVLSLNESAIRVLHRGRSELLHRPLFEVLYLKLQKGGLLNPQILGVEHIIQEKKVAVFENLLLVATDLPIQRVRLTVTPVLDMEGSVEQLSFVIVGENAYGSSGQTQGIVEQAHVRQEAMLEDLKRKLAQRGFMELWTQLLLIEKSNEDIVVCQTIQDHGIESQKEIIDISRLCSRIVTLEQGYAKAFGVQLQYSMVNLGWRVSESFQNSLHGNAEQSTDPFFTVKCNVRYVSVLIEKLIDLSVLLSSHSAHPDIQFIIGAERSDLVVVWLKVQCPDASGQQLSQLFEQGYGDMRSWKNFQFGSGLEGYIAKTIATYLDLALDVHYNKDVQECVFTLQVPRDVQVMSSVAVLRS